jgi:hypothetical protein
MQKRIMVRARMASIILLAIFLGTFTTKALAEKLEFSVLIGEWVRPDGGYKIQIRDIKFDGSTNVGYYNPDRINVTEAKVSLWKGLVKLFIKLQDKGYPGSTYTLYYYAEEDVLAGFYYQAEMRQTFEVVFIRNPN